MVSDLSSFASAGGDFARVLSLGGTWEDRSQQMGETGFHLLPQERLRMHRQVFCLSPHEAGSVWPETRARSQPLPLSVRIRRGRYRSQPDPYLTVAVDSWSSLHTRVLRQEEITDGPQQALGRHLGHCTSAE
jgi:hypothetical protein